MKTPREEYAEKHGKPTPKPAGGKARARQQQFEQARSTPSSDCDSTKEKPEKQ